MNWSKCPRSKRIALALGPLFTAMFSAAITLVAVPATVAMVMSHLVGS